jgi:tetratricopeptide (TPR) repeat protein
VLTTSFVFLRKSQIAFEYARRCSGERAVFWVKANTLENAEAGYLAIASSCIPHFRNASKKDTFLAAKQYLERPDTMPWFLVLDNADDKELFVKESEGLKLIDFIPQASHGQVLITTSDSRMVSLADGQIIPAKNGLRVGPMCLDDGFCLFQNANPWALGYTLSECRDFLNMLGGLPLAIVQAASYMREERMSVKDFVSLYNKDFESHGELFQQSAMSIELEQKSVLFTWEISYKRIAGELYPESKSQPAMLLDLLGFMDSQSSDLRALSEAEFCFKDAVRPSPIHGLENLFEAQKPPSSLLEGIYNNHFKLNDRFRSAVARLSNYSLINSQDCWVHPVVHSWISRRLPVEERCKYIEWVVDELLKEIRNADRDSEDGWEEFVLPNYNAFYFGELTALRHARVVLKHIQSRTMANNITARRLSTRHFGELLYQTGRMTASMGNTKDGIDYLEKAIKAMDGLVDPSLIAESQLRLAKIRNRINSRSDAITEARRCCVGEVASLPAALWLAQCLQSGGRLEEALEIFDNIINTSPICQPTDFVRMKEVFAATTGLVFVLSDIGDSQSKARARYLIDHSIAPFIKGLPYRHMLKTILYPKILICRVEVADGPRDQAIAAHNLVEHDENIHSDLDVSLTGGLPQEWYSQIEELRRNKKWSVVEVVAENYVKCHHSVPNIMSLLIQNRNSPEQLDSIIGDIATWFKIYYRLGGASFELQNFGKADKAHWAALGLWLGGLSLGLCTITDLPEFQANIWKLHRALSHQGHWKDRQRKIIERYISERLANEKELRKRYAKKPKILSSASAGGGHAK